MEVWGIKNFYVSLENICEEGGEFTFGYFALVVVSALIATGGLLSNSIPIIVGSMCIAPFLGPSRAVSIGGVYKEWKQVARGLAKQAIGLLGIGSTLAFLATMSFKQFASGITVTTTIIARTFPTLTSLYLASFVAIASGAAASLALVANPKMLSLPTQQLIDVMIGAEIAISLIPPAAVVGIGFALNAPKISLQALGLLAINVVCLDFIAMSVLYVRGVRLEPLNFEKKVRQITEKIINEDVNADEISMEVTLQGLKKADVLVRVETSESQCEASKSVAERISAKISEETGMSNRVKVLILPVCSYAS